MHPAAVQPMASFTLPLVLYLIVHCFGTSLAPAGPWVQYVLVHWPLNRFPQLLQLVLPEEDAEPVEEKEEAGMFDNEQTFVILEVLVT